MSYPSSQSGYSNIPPAGNPRETEAWALTEAARRMADAQRRDSEADLLAAIRLNWRLWTIFQAELSVEECPLPTDMRINMLSLSNFVDKTTVDIIADPQAHKANILISINRNIAAGLFDNPGVTPDQGGSTLADTSA